MRRAILWLHVNGGRVAENVFGVVMAVVFGGLILWLLGAIVAVALYGEASPEHAAWPGSAVVIGIIGTIWGVNRMWCAAVRWAESPPKVKPPRGVVGVCLLESPPPDPFLEAARREVETIAPSDSDA